MGLFEGMKYVFKFLADKLLDSGYEPLGDRISNNLSQKNAEQELVKIVEKALTSVTGNSTDDWSRYRWVLALYRIKNTKEIYSKIIAATLEMTSNDERLIPDEIIRLLNLRENDRQELSNFLFSFRKALVNNKFLSPAIQYADSLDARGKLAGIYELLSSFSDTILTIDSGESALRVQVIGQGSEQIEEKYLTNLLHEYEGLFLERRSKDESIRPDFQIRLARVYTTLNTTLSRQIHIGEIERAERGMSGEAVPVFSQLPISCLRYAMESRYMILLGDPGSGKSTFVQHLTICLAGARLNPESEWSKYLSADDIKTWELPYYPLPIYVRLRNLGQGAFSLPTNQTFLGQAENLLSYINDEIQRIGGNRIERHLQELLHQGQVLVILDGLDEVTDPSNSSSTYQREFIAQAICSFRMRFPHSRILVTCRTKLYPTDSTEIALAPWGLPGFAIARIKNLDPDQIKVYVHKWFDELNVRNRQWGSKVKYERKRDSLLQELQKDYLAELAGLPILLTQMVLLHTYKELPISRISLYKESTELLLWEWERIRALQSGRYGISANDYLQTLLPGIRLDEVEGAIDKAVFFSFLESLPDIPKYHLRDFLSELFEKVYQLPPHEAISRSEKFINDWIQFRNGLLYPSREKTYDMPHNSFKEFISGRYIRENRFEYEGVEESWKQAGARFVKKDIGKWGEVFRYATALEESPAEVAVALDEILPEGPPSSHADVQTILLAGEIACDAGGRLIATRSKLGRMVYQTLITYLDNIMKSNWPTIKNSTDLFPVKTRFRAGELLNDVGWIPVDLDEIIKIEDENRYYWIGKYLVTNLQYQRFLESPDYSDPDIWNSVEVFLDNTSPIKTIAEEAWNWFQANGGALRHPTSWYDSRFGLSRRIYPVVGITWYEAAAYCSWLNRHWKEYIISPVTELHFRLPLEDEWEQAANRLSPITFLGNESIDQASAKANTLESGLSSTTPVCMYPNGMSSNGVYDMFGNAWEWLSATTLNSDSYRKIKGGAWYLTRQNASLETHNHALAVSSTDYIGFRIVAFEI